MKSFILKLIRVYQDLTRAGVSSPVLLGGYSGCRSWPTCSEYAHAAIERDGIMRGGFRAITRFVRCNPLTQTHSTHA